MPRALWNGSLSFGLVNVPVQLVSAVRDVDVHFHQLHAKDGARIETRRFCKKEDREVDYEEIGREYEKVILTDEELEAAAPERTRTIDIEAFVDLADVDPILYDHPYVLLPSGESEGVRRAYRLLVDVMSKTERAALGRFVLRTKEHLGLVRVRDGRLTLTTMLFSDEIRAAKQVDTGKAAKPQPEAVQQAVALLDELYVEWNPTRYKDRYQRRLREVIRRKEKGQTIKAVEPDEQPAPVVDLMAALEKSLADAKKRRGKKAA